MNNTRFIDIGITCESMDVVATNGRMDIDLKKLDLESFDCEKIVEQLIRNVDYKYVLKAITRVYEEEDFLDFPEFLEFARKILKVHDKFIDIRDENAR